jgi:hypothetical protein
VNSSAGIAVWDHLYVIDPIFRELPTTFGETRIVPQPLQLKEQQKREAFRRQLSESQQNNKRVARP